MNRDHHLVAQGAAAVVADEIARQQAKCNDALANQDHAFAKALVQIQKLRNVVGSPEKILGSPLTKSGEIGEYVEFHVRNAWDDLHQRDHSVFIDKAGSARFGSIDYHKAGRGGIQLKCINGIRNAINAINEHCDKYPGFSSKNGFDIPKDQYEAFIRNIRSKGAPSDGMSSRTTHTIYDKVRQFENATGQRFEEKVQPTVFKYADVQPGNVHHFIENTQREIQAENENLRDSIQIEHQPGWITAGAAAAKGAAVGAALRLGAGIWRKAKEGRNVFYGELTPEDWKELGIDTAIGAAQGGVAAGVIFLLTQQADLAAPFAGAFVSTAMGIATLAQDYQSGKISRDEFVELGMLNCFEGAVVGLAAAAGRTLIPIPVIGAILGSVAGRLFVSLGKDLLGAQDTELARRLAEIHETCMTGLDIAYRDLVERIDRRFQELGDLTKAAFDLTLNAELCFTASVQLARAYGVDEGRMIHGPSELDEYMMS